MTAAQAPRLGAKVEDGGIRFSVWSDAAERVDVSLFDAEDREFDRVALARQEGGLHTGHVAALLPGARYGLRADGPYVPEQGQWFDPAKLLVDPYATAIDRPFAYDPRLALRRGMVVDTASLMPKCVVPADLPTVERRRPFFEPGGLVYEVNVRGFTKLHPDVPEPLRGTVGALAHPAVVEHLTRLRVSAVELMPIAAWMDERHLPPLGLANAWGYNPVAFMALDPRLAPDGWGELRDTVATLHEAGVGVILDVVFNHTAESDALGPTLSLRGLDGRAYFRHHHDGSLVNDTGCGNTLDCMHPATVRLVLDSLRAFVLHAGVDGFRFDLAPVLGRGPDGFDPDAPLLAAMREDEVLADRVMIAEPWDVGPGGYRLGGFRPPFLEWNDRYRDDVRRFWRGDAGAVGAFATRLAGSSDVFGSTGETRSIDFLAAHDGMTLADLVAFEHRHNEANGEQNRDGHGDNLSWNHGVEGPSDDAAILGRRRRDLRALLATLFVSRGTIMLTAGDEFGRTQNGNNNAYAQDNALTWLDWQGRDRELEELAVALSALRAGLPTLARLDFLTGGDVTWFGETGLPLGVGEWEDPARKMLGMLLEDRAGAVAILFNAGDGDLVCTLPERGVEWSPVLDTAGDGRPALLAGRSVQIHVERGKA